jgi:hypothetical protein
MSAAATAAGYLYASGRLRGRGGKEEGENSTQQEKPRARKVRVEVYQPEAPAPQEKPKRIPKIEYRTRRWTPHE